METRLMEYDIHTNRWTHFKDHLTFNAAYPLLERTQVSARSYCTIFILYIVSALVAMTFAVNVCIYGGSISDRGDLSLKLNIFSEEQLIDVLDDGGPRFSPRLFLESVSRNASGTRVFVDSSYGKKCWVLAISENVTTQIIYKPASIAFMDESGDFIAWTNNFSEKIHFSCGVTLPLNLSSRLGFDPSGTYFFVREPSITKVFRTNDLSCVLTVVNVATSNIFSYKEEFYLLGYPGDGDLVGPVVCQVFKITEEVLVGPVEEIIINRPSRFCRLRVEDMDPGSKKVLLRSHFDPPATFLSSWYVYDIRKDKLVKLGRIGEGIHYGLFLAGDLFDAVSE